jgi:hypothetical protein
MWPPPGKILGDIFSVHKEVSPKNSLSLKLAVAVARKKFVVSSYLSFLEKSFLNFISGQLNIEGKKSKFY